MSKKRSPAQRAATSRMLAANRKKRGGKSAKRKSNPIAIHRKAGSSVARRVKRSVRRRNPLSLGSLRGQTSGVVGMTKDAFIGATGALVINTVSNYLPLPDSMKIGYGKHAVRAAIAVGVGVFGSRIVSKRLASSAAVGALTVILHDVMLQAAQQAAPSLLLGDALEYNPMAGLSEFTDVNFNGVEDYDAVNEYDTGY